MAESGRRIQAAPNRPTHYDWARGEVTFFPFPPHPNPPPPGGRENKGSLPHQGGGRTIPPTPTLPHQGGGRIKAPSPTRGEGEPFPPPQPSPTRGEGALLLPPPLWGRVGVGGESCQIQPCPVCPLLLILILCLVREEEKARSVGER